MGWKGCIQGMVVGSIFGGSPGTLIGGIVGDAIESYSSNNIDTEKIKNLYYSFFHCLGHLAGSDPHRIQFASELLRAWYFGDALTGELLAEFRAGINSRKSFSSLVTSLNRAADAIGNAVIKYNATQVLCMFIPVANPISGELKKMEMAGEILGTSIAVETFMANYYIYHRNSGVSVIPLAESYAILNISASASAFEVKKAFRKKSLKLPVSSERMASLLSSEFGNSVVMQFEKSVKAYKSICLARGIK